MNGARPAVCVNVCGSRMKKCVDDQGKDRRTTSLGYLRMWIQGLGRQRQQHPVGPKRQKCSPVLKRKKATEVETAVRLCRSLPERRRGWRPGGGGSGGRFFGSRRRGRRRRRRRFGGSSRFWRRGLFRFDSAFPCRAGVHVGRQSLGFPFFFKIGRGFIRRLAFPDHFIPRVDFRRDLALARAAQQV